MKADLHIHSVFSDGSDSRESILQKAAAVGIKVLAFTEHDTTEGWQESNCAWQKVRNNCTAGRGNICM